jgi:hypothetical protein
MISSAVLAVTALAPVQVAALDPAGEEFQVNTYTSCNQDDPSVAVLDSGDFVVVWESGSSAYEQDGSLTGVYAQRYDSDGVRIGGEFRVNNFTQDEQEDVAIAAMSDGGFVVAWHSWEQDGDGYAVVARRYDSDGVADEVEFQVNTYTTDWQSDAGVAAVGDGFVVVWDSYDQDGDTWGVFGRRYDADATPLSDEFPISQFTTGEQHTPEIAALQNGRFVVVWTSYQAGPPWQDGSETGVFGRVYRANGKADGPEFGLASYTTGVQWRPRVAPTDDGGFIAVWESPGFESGPEAGDGVVARKFDSSGVPAAPEYRVNDSTLRSQEDATISAHPDGGFLVAWESPTPLGTELDGDDGVFARKLDENGQPEGDEFQVNTYTTGEQRDPRIAPQGAGYVVVWEGTDDQDGALLGVFGQRFSQVVCGDASGDGQITATDALASLTAAVGAGQCLLCVCDVDGSGGIAATDALLLLNFAVGQPVSLTCPAC